MQPSPDLNVIVKKRDIVYNESNVVESCTKLLCIYFNAITATYRTYSLEKPDTTIRQTSSHHVLTPDPHPFQKVGKHI